MLCKNFVCCWLKKNFWLKTEKMRSFGFLVAFYCEDGKEEALNEEAVEIQSVVTQAGTFEED